MENWNLRSKMAIAALVVSALAGCAHTAPVIPEEGGIFVAQAAGDSRDDALKQALRTAHKTCEERGKSPIVVQSKQGYDGLVSEKTGDAISKVKDVAGALGAGVPSLTDGDYKLQLTFKCE